MADATEGAGEKKPLVPVARLIALVPVAFLVT